MKKFLFIGEDRSEKAIQMNVRWENGSLAAKQLFEALLKCGIDPKECQFMNLFEPLRQQGILHSSHRFWIAACGVNGFKTVALGNKVSDALTKMGISHIKIVHPAARGRIRKKEKYFAHVNEILNARESENS